MSTAANWYFVVYHPERSSNPFEVYKGIRLDVGNPKVLVDALYAFFVRAWFHSLVTFSSSMLIEKAAICINLIQECTRS